MSVKNPINEAIDLAIVIGYSAFAFAVMPVFVFSAWLAERFSSEWANSDSQSN
ncbi:MAG: hypothetical protein AAFR31_15710 [Cyanobacteria bacterium J06627_8]